MRGTVQKKGNKWYAVLYTGKDELTGKWNRKWFSGFKTKKEAEKFLAEKVSEVAQGRYTEPSKETFGEYLETWLEDKKLQVRPSTWKTYDWLARCYVIPQLGKMEISKIKPAALQKFYHQLQNRDEPLSARTVIQVHLLIKASLDRAVKWGMIPNNPTGAVDPPRYRKKEMEIWTEDEVRKFLEAAESHRLFGAFHLAVSTGMRMGEILGLRWSDIDFTKRSLSISQALAIGEKGYVLQEPKTKSGKRSIALSQSSMIVLEKHKRKQAAEKLRAGSIYRDQGLVFASTVGTPINSRNFARVYYNLRKKADVTPINFHSIRHTHASLMLKQGVHPKVVSERLGHSNISITLDTYSHVIPGLQQAAIDHFDDVLFGSQTVDKKAMVEE
ncbi:site-specific integrase [Brevibacillus panacihumi]|uniref:Site-specific integrase n=1 Tax=Brevibacillus panacihumi TaxID=497735 RepID=A0A3M8CTJ7_9BACL|nr:site-specific integrase [Brevibacillus panacihumi]RNB79034.1 site-specific integrase [Brevibacillus panacihumi]